MAQAAPFSISEFTNPSGDIVFRVTGWLDGIRIRKNFPTRAEAMAERQTLEIQRVQSDTGVRTTATRLSDEQFHEADAAFRRVGGKPRSLSFYLDYALANYREPESQKSLSEAVADYKRAKAHEHEQGQLTSSTVVAFPPRFRISNDTKSSSSPAALSFISAETNNRGWERRQINTCHLGL